ncbi:MAG: serine/threonine protein kinase [Phycisphaerales bacterium]|nr:serine/threonine protein kinase [Phycisphaerales bacterium]MCB9864301.1 serine/threonine protein kinase [Phycisphaerales bacterium]
MSEDREARVDALIEKALHMPASERDDFLHRECAGDASLYRMLQHMCAGESELPDDFLGGDIENELPPPIGDANPEETSTPETIGAYRIIREIGRGGMGIVYEAEQQNPRRRVALKVVRQGLNTASLISRLRQEAHVLGQLQHPGIAQVYEAGTATIGDSNLPFIAMELLQGASIVDAARYLSLRDRLELIARVCDAVQHAHQKGVIHRDLKPANIIVLPPTDPLQQADGTGTSIDNIGRPKVLDFGIARLLDADMQFTTIHTHAGQIIGTLGYMSPEQVAGDREKIDTRCDVYSIGAILFEILTGRRPLELGGKPVAEAARIIREEEPTRAGAIDRSLRGDIETIIARAMEKEPDLRYASAAELAADIRRFLHHEPIEARPASSLYQIRKFARRNKGLVGGLAAAFLALFVGLIATASSLREARSQRDAAQAARLESERVAEFQAKLLSGQSARAFGNDLLADIRSEYRRALEKAGSDQDRIDTDYAVVDQALHRITGVNIGRTVLSRYQAGRALKLLESGFTDDPVIEARLRDGIGLVYSDLGMYGEAAGQFEHVVDLRRKHLGPDHCDTLIAMTQVGVAFREMGQTEKAEAILRNALDRQRRTLGAENDDTLNTMASLSRLLSGKLDFEEAESLLTEALTTLKRTHGPNDPLTLNRANELGLLHIYEGKLNQAASELRELLDVRKRLSGADSPEVVATRTNLMSTLFKLNRLEEAEPIAQEVLESSERVHGRDDPTTIMARSNLGMVCFRLGDYERATDLFRQAHDAAEQRMAPQSEIRMKATTNLIDGLLALHRPQDAEPLCLDLLEVRRGIAGGRADLVAQTLEQLGWSRFDQNRIPDAVDSWRECVTLREGIAPDHWLTNRARSELGMALAASDQLSEAESLLKASYLALFAQRETIPPGDGATCIQDAQTRLVRFYQATNRIDEANRWKGEPATSADF